MKQITDSITSVTSEHANRGLPVLLVGDFNARHSAWGDNNGGHNFTSGSRHLANFIANSSLHILNNQYSAGIPTHQNPQHSSIIDLAITSDPSLVRGMDMSWRYRLSSDHIPLTITLQHTLAASPPPPSSDRLHWRHHENAEQWHAALPIAMSAAFDPLLPQFQALTNAVPPGVTRQSVIDDVYQQFEEVFLSVCHETVGTKLPPRPTDNRWWSQPGVLPAYRSALIARRRYSHKRSAATLHEYKSQLRAWRAAVKRARRQADTSLCDKVNSADAKKRWAAVARSQPSSFAPLASIPDANGNLPIGLRASLNNLCAAFVSDAVPPPPPHTFAILQYQQLHQWTDPTQSTLPPHPSDNWAFTASDVESQCTHQHIQSAPGPDNILPAFLRHAGATAHLILSLLFNFSWCHAVLPQSWTEANVMALYKGAADAARGKPAGSRASASSYRPISMTSILIRTFEHLIHKRLVTELESRNYFSPLQFGFRANHTTTDAINYLLSTIRRICKDDSYHIGSDGKRRRHKMPCPVIFLDIKKAFDRVWHPRLLTYLHDAGITGRAWRWIRAFLSRRRIRTVQLTTCSDWHTVEYGVPQGSVLSPLLFLVFINPILVRVMHECPLVCPIAFADDGVLAPSIIVRDPAAIAAHNQRRALQHLPPVQLVGRKFKLEAYLTDLHKALALLDIWCKEGRVVFGADKTKLVVFCGAQSGVDMTPFSQFTLCGFTIGVAEHYTYLGVVLHHKLGWELHFEKALATARQISSHLTRLTLGATTPHFPSTRTLVLCLLLPSFAYAIALWGRDLSDFDLRRFNSALAQPLRRCLRLPRTSHQLGVLVEANIPSVSAWMKRELLMLYSRLGGLPPDHPAKQMHLFDLTPPTSSSVSHLILAEGKYISTSRFVQLVHLPTLSRDLHPFILQHSPANHPARNILVTPPAVRADGSDPFAYLGFLTSSGTGRRAHLMQHLNPVGNLQDVVDWADTASADLLPSTIRPLTMWMTHHEWRQPADPTHTTDAPLLLCKPYPRPTHFLALEAPPIAHLRARFRARRNFTLEHRRQLEDKSASAACTHPICQTVQPAPPDDTVEHILLHCPRHDTIRTILLNALRAATTPHSHLTLPFILGEAVDVAVVTKGAKARYSHLLHISATFLQHVDVERQAAHLVAFKPP
jgi:hypothetical protein